MNKMKKSGLTFLTALAAIGTMVFALALTACPDGTETDGGSVAVDGSTITVLTGPVYTRTVPELGIIKATDEYVLVGYEVPKNQDPDTAIDEHPAITVGGKSVATVGEDAEGGFDTDTNWGSDLFDSGDDRTYRYVTISRGLSSTDVVFDFQKQYTRTAGGGETTTTTTTIDTERKVVTVKPGDFKTRPASYTIPAVTAGAVTVYSGKEGDTNGTYNAMLGENYRLLVVTLPTDGIAKYLKYRYKYADGDTSWGYYSEHDYGDSGSTFHTDPDFDYESPNLNGKAIVSISAQTRYQAEIANDIQAKYSSLKLPAALTKLNSQPSNDFSAYAIKDSERDEYYPVWEKTATTTDEVALVGEGGTVYVELNGTPHKANELYSSYGSSPNKRDFSGPYVPYTIGTGANAVEAKLPVTVNTVKDLPRTVDLKFATAADNTKDTATADANIYTITLSAYTAPTGDSSTSTPGFSIR